MGSKAPSTLAASQTGLLALGQGHRVSVWKDVCQVSKPQKPYLVHEIPGDEVQTLKFRPYEDFCFIGTRKGIETMVVPGSSIANFDSMSADPYESKKVSCILTLSLEC